MVVVANGIIFAWPGTNAAIPTGWTRETALDGYYIQAPSAGADADLVTVRGNANHNHTSPSHTPIQNSHTHQFFAGEADTPVGTFNDFAETIVAGPTHTHASTTSASATGTNNGVAITVDATNNDLAFARVIFIKSDGTPTGVPNNAYGFFQSDILPVGWSRVQGDRYLKGAVAGGDGGTISGSNSHAHTSPAHTHTQNSHSHVAVTSGNSDTVVVIDTSFGGFLVAANPHTHSVSLNSTTPTNQSVTTTINSTNAEPVFKKINLIANGSGGESLPNKIVGLWGGTNATIPTDWARVTGMDGNFPKHANANGESMISAGGSLTHTHTASSCQPIQNTHGHSGTAAGGADPLSAANDFGLVGADASDEGHTHVWVGEDTIATNQAVAVTINTSASEAHYPQYKQVIFIEFTEPPVAGHQGNLALLNVGF